MALHPALALFALGAVLFPAIPIDPPLPDTCPALSLTRAGGLGSESESGVLVAVWDSGLILRAASRNRASGSHVLGHLDPADLDAVIRAAQVSPLWTKKSGGVAVDATAEEIQLQRKGVRVGWAESPGVNQTQELRALTAVLFSATIQQSRNVRVPAEMRWSCPPVQWQQ